MASSAEVAAYRAAGHSVADTMAYFDIKERAVYKACQVARAKRSRAVHTLHNLPEASRQPVFREVATDEEIAGETSYWKCPVTGELLPVIPGSKRKTWNEERIALHRRLANARQQDITKETPAPATEEKESAPVRAPEPQDIPLQSESAPESTLLTAPPALAPRTGTPTLPLTSEHIIIVKRYPIPENHDGLLAGVGEYLHDHMPPPNIVLAFAVVLVLILMCSR